MRALALVATSDFNTVQYVDRSRVVPGIGFPRWDGTLESMRETMTSIIHHAEAVTDVVLRLRTDAAERQRAAYEAAASWNREAEQNPNRRRLLRLQGRLHRLTIPMVYLYGRQDVLGPVGNAYLQEDRLPNVPVL